MFTILVLFCQKVYKVIKTIVLTAQMAKYILSLLLGYCNFTVGIYIFLVLFATLWYQLNVIIEASTRGFWKYT